MKDGRLVHKLSGFDARFENVGVEAPLPPSLRFIRSVNGSVLYVYWRDRAFRKMRGCE